jgi:hypothetical protein
MPPKVRDYKKEYQQQKKRGKKELENRAARERVRYEAENPGKDGKVTRIKGKDIDHKRPLSKGGSNKPSNLRQVSPSKNRSFKRNSDGSVKRNTATGPKKKSGRKK